MSETPNPPGTASAAGGRAPRALVPWLVVGALVVLLIVAAVMIVLMLR